jgi:IS30 family transposase
MKAYRRLTLRDRYRIELLKNKGETKRGMARYLDVNPSTICRELAKCGGFYNPDKAQLKTDNYNQKRAQSRLKIQGRLKKTVDRNLTADFSPEQLSACLKKERNISISFQTIYRYIERDKLGGGKLKSHLRILSKKRKDRKRPKYKKCEGLVKNRVPISKRPKVVERRSRIGDYERDTLWGKHGGPVLLTIVERKSRYVRLESEKIMNAQAIHRATVRGLKNKKVFSITNDNGVEFAFHEKTSARLKTPIYFSRSYASWERGTNENINGLIRQYCPRKTALPLFTSKQLRALELKLNKRPKKCLGYKTPYEIYHKRKSSHVLR